MIDQALKYRIVGAVVLLGLAAVVLPLLLDGANESSLLADTRMPAPPDVPKAEVLLADPPATAPEIEAEIDAVHQPAEPEQPEPVAVAPGAPSPVPPPAATSATTQASAPAPVSAPAAVPPAVPSMAPPPPADPRLATLAEAWVVQVAALSTPEAAEKLRAKLAQAGYKAKVAPVGRLFRVSVGPELRKEDAIAIRDRIAADARFGKPQGRIAHYVP